MVGNGPVNSTAASPGANRMFVNGAPLAARMAQRRVRKPEQVATSLPSSTTRVLAGAACAGRNVDNGPVTAASSKLVATTVINDLEFKIPALLISIFAGPGGWAVQPPGHAI